MLVFNARVLTDYWKNNSVVQDDKIERFTMQIQQHEATISSGDDVYIQLICNSCRNCDCDHIPINVTKICFVLEYVSSYAPF